MSFLVGFFIFTSVVTDPQSLSLDEVLDVRTVFNNDMLLRLLSFTGVLAGVRETRLPVATRSLSLVVDEYIASEGGGVRPEPEVGGTAGEAKIIIIIINVKRTNS